MTMTSNELKNVEEAIQFTTGKLTTLLGEAADTVFIDNTNGTEVMIDKCVGIELDVKDILEILFGYREDRQVMHTGDYSHLSL